MKQLSYSLSSCVPEIERLRFWALARDKAIEVLKIARHQNTTLYLATDGKIYSEGVRSSGHFCKGRGRMDDYLRCCVKLGLITRAQMETHFKDASASDKQSEMRRRNYEFKKQAEKLGVVLNLRQLKQLAKFGE